jgi:chromosome segregation ATPase
MTEFLLGLLRQLASTLSPFDFIVVLFLIASGTFFTMKFIFKNTRSSGGLLDLFAGTLNDERIEQLTKKLDETASKNELIAVEKRIINVLDEMRREAQNHSSDLSEHVKAISIIKVELENSFDQINKQIDSIQQQIKMHDMHDDAQFAVIKDNITRSQELMNKVLSQIEKIDEFIRTTVPEFRSYHKELTKEVSTLNRDINVMDRVLQAQINTNKEGITLR